MCVCVQVTIIVEWRDCASISATLPSSTSWASESAVYTAEMEHMSSSPNQAASSKTFSNIALYMYMHIDASV